MSKKDSNMKRAWTTTRLSLAVRGVSCAVCLVAISGCAKDAQPRDVGDVSEPVVTAARPPSVDSAEPPASLRPSSEIALASGSRLASLSRQLDQVAIAQSSAQHEVRAAEAELAARRFERYPQIRPTASAPLTGGGSPAFGVSVEQTVWDGGRVRARLTASELRIAQARLQAWRTRNEVVYEGLKAFVEMSRLQERLDVYGDLRADLTTLADLLETRASGGVADRGELLRMNAALQEIQRRFVEDTGNLRQARTDLLRLMPPGATVMPLNNLVAATGQCRRTWPESEAPDDALARIQMQNEEVSEDVVRAQRFPRVVLGAGSEYSSNGWSEPAVALRLDASNMLGLGRRRNIEAAESSTQAAEANYRLQKDDTRADLARLDGDYDGYRSDMSLLEELQNQARATLNLYEEQLEAGSIPIIEGITVHREAADTRIAIVDLQADTLMNCLQASRIRGLLAPFGENDET